jgi:N-acetylglutamate synthase-like GNAT family acetyltransferase
MVPHFNNPNAERNNIEIENSFVACCDDSIVGVASYILLSDQIAETASLAVDPKYKGQGIGFNLQTSRLQEMYSRGIRKVYTETDRQDTIKWYIKYFGYCKKGKNRKKHDFSLTNVDEWTVLELDLTQELIDKISC